MWTSLLLAVAHAQVPGIPVGPPAGALRVEIVDEEGIEIPFATVALACDLAAPREGVSDADGDLSFHEVPPGLCAMDVHRPGFMPVRVEGILIAADRTTVQAVELHFETIVCELPILLEDWDVFGVSRRRWLDRAPLPAAPGIAPLASLVGADPRPAGVEIGGQRVASPGERVPAVPWTAVDGLAASPPPDARTMAPGGRTVDLRLREPTGWRDGLVGIAGGVGGEARVDLRLAGGATQVAVSADRTRAAGYAAHDFDVEGAEGRVVQVVSGEPGAVDGLVLAAIRGNGPYAGVVARGYRDGDATVGRLAASGGWDRGAEQAGFELERHAADRVAVERLGAHGAWRPRGRWAALDLGGRVDHQQRHGRDGLRRVDLSPRVVGALVTPGRVPVRVLAGLVGAPAAIGPAGDDLPATLSRELELAVLPRRVRLWAHAAAPAPSWSELGELPPAGAWVWTGGGQFDVVRPTPCGTFSPTSKLRIELWAAAQPDAGWSSATARLVRSGAHPDAGLVSASIGVRDGPEPVRPPGAEPFLAGPADDGARVESALVVGHGTDPDRGPAVRGTVTTAAWWWGMSDGPVRATARVEAAAQLRF